MSRFNIYSEELTDRIEKVTKEANGGTFYGLRFYLRSPPELHHDDTSAMTFWANSEDELVDLMDLARAVAGY
jgi:hypothetical protein